MKKLIQISFVAALVALMAACGTTSNSKSAGEVIDDAVITARVETAFARDKRVSALDIEVEVFKGIVQLSGFVNDRDQIRWAEEIASNVPGVVDVRNRIDVKGG